MDELASAMLRILATWVAFAAVVLGLGVGAMRVTGPVVINAPSLRRAAWLGLACVIAALQVWHLFLPVGAPAAAMLAMLALPGLVLLARHARRAFGARARSREKLPLVLVVVFALALLWLANLSAGPGGLYDTGLYHLQAVRWNHEHAIVPGLGNLHSRFAFNNAGFLVAALFEGVGWRGQSSHVFNGFLAALLCAHLISLLVGWTRSDAASRAGAAFAAALFPGVIVLALRPLEMPSLSTDFASAMATAACVALLAEAVWRLEIETTGRGATLLALIGAFGAAATIKLSAAVLAGGGGLVALALLLPQAWFEPGRRRLCAALLAAIALTVGVWSARSVVLSGYPFYPSPMLAAPVAWRLPTGVLEVERERTYQYSLGRPDAVESWLGVPSSFRGLPLREVAVPMMLLVLGWIVRGLLQRAAVVRRPSLRRLLTRTMWVFMPVMLAIIFWATTAPAPRFAFVLVWLMAAVSIAATVIVLDAALVRGGESRDENEDEESDGGDGDGREATSNTPAHRRVRWGVGAAAVLLSSASLVVMLPPPITWLNYGTNASGVHPMPTAPMDEAILTSGLHVFVPRGTDQCWDAPLPCAPSPSPTLQLRRTGDAASGFIDRE